MKVKEAGTSRRIWEYILYINILLLCIGVIYWRFWHRPCVKPTVLIDAGSIRNKAEWLLKKPLLDPAFDWTLTRTELYPPKAYFVKDGAKTGVSVKPGDRIGGWRIKEIKRGAVILEQNHQERVLYTHRP